uniref:Uncharacterized protein n=1 Tax=Heterorhabditis bacteriophora TaxID=37862 RepID=A0A1I7WM79_HETBA
MPFLLYIYIYMYIYNSAGWRIVSLSIYAFCLGFSDRPYHHSSL